VEHFKLLKILARHGVPVVVIGGHDVRFVSLDWLRRMKGATDRTKDAEDLRQLEGQ
jgi:hypothetical protein